MGIGPVHDLVPFLFVIEGEGEALGADVPRIKVPRVRTVEYLVEEHPECSAETGHAHHRAIRLRVIVVYPVGVRCALYAPRRKGDPRAAGWFEVSEHTCYLYHRAPRILSGWRTYRELYGDQ